jgi:hypothetical protein
MRLSCLAIALACIGFTAGCKPVFAALPDSDCPKIVKHSKVLLGAGVRDKTDEELLEVCKASSPKQRGCAMAATKGADIMKCSLVKD